MCETALMTPPTALNPYNRCSLVHEYHKKREGERQPLHGHATLIQEHSHHVTKLFDRRHSASGAQEELGHSDGADDNALGAKYRVA